MPYQVCTNDESGLTLTFFTAGPSLIPNAFIIGKISKCSSFYNCLSKVENIYINILRSFDQNGHHVHI